MKRGAARSSTRPPWRSAIARTIARPRPEPGSPLARGRARSARRRALGLVGESPGPSSATLSAAAVHRATVTRSSAPRPVRCARCSTRLASARSQRLGGRPATSTRPAPRPRTRGSPSAARARQRRRGRPRRPGACRPRPRARARAGRRARRASRAASALELGDRLGVGTVAGEVVDVAAQRGQRRAQLVRGVGEEAALGLARALERWRASRSACRASSPHLVARGRGRQAALGVAGALDVRGARGQPAERAQRAARERATASAPSAAAASAAR